MSSGMGDARHWDGKWPSAILRPATRDRMACSCSRSHGGAGRGLTLLMPVAACITFVRSEANGR